MELIIKIVKQMKGAKGKGRFKLIVEGVCDIWDRAL